MCRELKRRQNKAAKAERAAENAQKQPAKAAAKPAVASEDDLTPNVRVFSVFLIVSLTVPR